MRRNLLISVILASGSLLAQAPGAPQQAPMGPGRATTPGTVNPQGPGNPNDTMRMQNRVDDKKFVSDAAMGGLTEVELGKLAAEKGSSDAVKQFGQKMVDDHSKVNEELKKLAGAQSITIPEALDSKHQARVDKLSKLSGAEFDKAYIKDQLKDHQQDVREFQDESQNGSDAAVKDFAAKTLPTLQDHLATVKGINKGKPMTAEADRSKQ